LLQVCCNKGSLTCALWRAVLATDLVRQDHDASRRPARVGAEPTEHACDRDRLGRVGDGREARWYALPDALVRSDLVAAALGLAQKVGEVLVVDEQHVVEQPAMK
jgi:hypothetical protein